jgi:cephalosporin hydroxylase
MGTSTAPPPASVRGAPSAPSRSLWQRAINYLFYKELIRATGDFSDVKWLGHPMWQDPTDAWVIQEAIAEVRPALLLETGTNMGGSALYYAHLLDLVGDGRVVTVDVERMHDISHPKIEFLIGGSTDPEIVETMTARAREADGPVMVILDANHAEDHVRAELAAYAPLVTPGSLMMVQDAIIDTMRHYRPDRPGPLGAIKEFVAQNPEFTVEDRARHFLVTHHPMGWLRRAAN